jgi:hypothetical protein
VKYATRRSIAPVAAEKARIASDGDTAAQAAPARRITLAHVTHRKR